MGEEVLEVLFVRLRINENFKIREMQKIDFELVQLFVWNPAHLSDEVVVEKYVIIELCSNKQAR